MRHYRPALACLLVACAPVSISPELRSIPQAIQGRWGETRADCTAPEADASGLLTIGPATLRDFKSSATLRSVSVQSATRFRGTFAFIGENWLGPNQKWDYSVSLELGDDLNTLRRVEVGDDTAVEYPPTFRYIRC